MAALDFPDTPAVGDLYGSSGVTWKWDGTRWGATQMSRGAKGIVGGLKTFVGTLPVAHNGTEVAIPGIAQTINAKAGRTYRVTASIGWTTGVQNDDDIAVSSTIRLDGVAKNQAIEGATSRFGAGYSCRNEYVWTQAVDATVAITVTGGAYASTGGAANGSIWGSAGVPMYSLVEDITYEAGSAGTPGGVPLGVTWTAGAGAPEGQVAAPVGSIYSRTDGSTSASLHRKVAGGNSTTGWSAAPSVYHVEFANPFSSSNGYSVDWGTLLRPASGNGFVQITIAGQVGFSGSAMEYVITVFPQDAPVFPSTNQAYAASQNTGVVGANAWRAIMPMVVWSPCTLGVKPRLVMTMFVGIPGAGHYFSGRISVIEHVN